MARGKRNTKTIVLGIVMVAILSIVMLSATGLLQTDWSQETEAGSTFRASITAYKDGEPVSEPIVMGSFSEDGSEIDSFVIDIWWTSTGKSVKWETFKLDGLFKVMQESEQAVTYQIRWDSTEVNGTWSKTLVLGTDLCASETIEYGDLWALHFECYLGASVENTLGDILKDDLFFEGSTTIYYTSDFNMQGGWNR